MDLPRPSPEHRSLARMAGTWVGAETISPSPWAPAGGLGQGRIEAALQIDGFFLISDYQQQVDGQVVFRGHGVYGWDATVRRYTMHWFDSMGDNPGVPALGVLEGERLTFVRQSPTGHGRYIYDFEADGRYRFRLQTSADGRIWETVMAAVYTRQ